MRLVFLNTEQLVGALNGLDSGAHPQGNCSVFQFECRSGGSNPLLVSSGVV